MALNPDLLAQLRAEADRRWPGLREAEAAVDQAEAALEAAQAALHEARLNLRTKRSNNGGDADYFLSCIRGLEEAYGKPA